MIKIIHPTVKMEEHSNGYCYECDKKLEEDESYRNPEGQIICEECDEKYYNCEDCGEKMHEDSSYWAGDYRYCQRCFEENYFYCGDCGEAECQDNGTYIEGHGTVCQNCYDNEYCYCEQCDTHYHYDDMVSLKDIDDRVCTACFENGVREGEYFKCEHCLQSFTKEEEGDDNNHCIDCCRGRISKIIHPTLLYK